MTKPQVIHVKEFVYTFLTRFIGLLIWSIGAVSAESNFIPLTGVLPPTVAKGETPFLVTGPLEVEEGGHTIIEKGVVFLFKNFTGITVNGAIRVEGTMDEPVVFTSENDTLYNPSSSLEPAAFDWDGITINKGESESVLEHSIIGYSLFGIKSLTRKIAIRECVFHENGNADVTIQGEKLLVTSPYNYSYEKSKEMAMPDIIEEQPIVEAPQEEDPEPETTLILEPEEEPEEKDDTKVSLVTEPKKKERTAGKVLFRLGSAITAFTGGVFGAKEHLDYISTKEHFDDINEFDDEDKMKYTSADWENEKDHTNDHMRKMFIFYGIGLAGLTLFAISFAF